MAIVLATTADRKAVSRRLVKIPIENEAYTNGLGAIEEAKNAFEEVDGANKIFTDHWEGVTNNYLNEYKIIGGGQFLTFTEGDIDDGATEAAGNIFYPDDTTVYGMPINQFLTPYISWFVNGYAVGVEPSCEEHRARDFEGLADMALNGLSSGINTKLAINPYSGGDVVAVLSAAGVTSDSYVLITGMDASAIPKPVDCIVYVRSVNTVANTLSVRYIGGDTGTGGIQPGAASGIVSDTFGPIWSDVVRKDIWGAALYPHSAGAVGDYMTTYSTGAATSWNTYLGQEKGFLNANDDERTTNAAENVTAVSNITTMESEIADWELFADTDVGGNSKFNDVALGAFLTASSVRVVQRTARTLQVLASMGTVVSGAGGTYTGVEGAIYERYKWLERRINRQFGSLKKWYAQDKAKDFVNSLIESNQSIADSYEEKMLATRLTSDGDGSNIVYVEDASIFIPSEFAYIIDEVQDEISFAIVNVDVNNNSLTLKTAVSSDYKTSELARIYKLL